MCYSSGYLPRMLFKGAFRSANGTLRSREDLAFTGKFEDCVIRRVTSYGVLREAPTPAEVLKLIADGCMLTAVC